MTTPIHSWLASLDWRETLWLSVGLVGQAMFTARWLVQWVMSEKSRRSVMPEAFWYLSFAGGVLVLMYGIHKADPVIILGQFGVLIYARNLLFLRRSAPSNPAHPAPAE